MKNLTSFMARIGIADPRRGAWQTSDLAAIPATLPLLVLVLLLLQYSALLHTMFAPLGQWRGVPLTLLFLAAVGTLLLPRLYLRLVAPTHLRSFLAAGALGIWAVATTWAYLRGSTVTFPDYRVFLVVALLVAGLLVLGWRADRPWFAFLGIAGFIVGLAAFTIHNTAFDDVFVSGRPLWNIRDAATRVASGAWMYEYGSYHSPSYLPFLFLFYLPFGMGGWDLRWVNVLAGLILLALLFWSIPRTPGHRSAPLLILLVVLSPFFTYNLLTCQLPFYWIFLTLCIVGVQTGRVGLQRSGLLLAGLARQLAWPLAVGWALYHLIPQFGRPGPILPKLRWLRPHIVDLAALAGLAIILLVDPRAFYWSAFTLPYSDALRTTSPALPQPAGAIALAPLLPFANVPLLVLLVQGVAVAAVCLLLTRSGYLFKQPAPSMILIYLTFLVLNIVVYDYYWVDLLVMILPVLLRGDTPVLEDARDGPYPVRA